MSLKARLRWLIVALVVTIVTALSIINVSLIVDSKIDDLNARAELVLRQVQGLTANHFTNAMEKQSAPPGMSLPDYYAQVLQEDETLPDTLKRMAADKSVVAEIQILDQNNRVLASNVPPSTKRHAENLPDLRTWKNETLLRKLNSLLTSSQDLSIVESFAPQDRPDQVYYKIRLLISPVLLRNRVESELLDMAVVFGVALAVSVLLAVIVSNLALRPIEVINKRLDAIAEGAAETVAHKDEFGTEIDRVQTKISLLGERFRDARQNAQQLRKNVDQLLQRLEEAVMLFDPQGVAILAGRPAERLLGRSQQELMGKTLDDLFPAATAQGSRIRNAIEMQTPLRDFPVILERPGQPAARLVLNLDFLTQADHAPMGMLLTLRDADLRREIYSQLDVSSRLAAINRLTSGVAHEIKNPLNAIRLHLEVLKSHLEHEPDATPSLQVIDSEILRLDKVVKTFLDFTRPVEFKLAEVNLLMLAQQVINLVRPAAQQRRVTVELDESSVPVTIRGDKDTLKQAILNLMINSIDAMSSGGQLKISTQHVVNEAVVTVSDTGCGIPPEVQDKVFQLYFTTKPEGSGIGLPMTFQVVQLHNGILEFQSEVGKGTTFRLRFPLLATEAPVTETASVRQSV